MSYVQLAFDNKKGKKKTIIIRIIRDYVIVSNFTNSGHHVVPSMTNLQLQLTRLRSLKSIFRHGNVVFTVLTASARGQGGGGHLLAEWGAFEIGQLLNFEHVFQGFLRQVEVGKKAGRYLDVFNNMAKTYF